jgi:hypothetical protein
MLTEHSPEVGTPPTERASWTAKILVPEMWGTVAIATMWLAVIFVGVFGSNNVVLHDSSGSSSSWPVVVVVAFFALLGTVPVARRAFRQPQD